MVEPPGSTRFSPLVATLLRVCRMPDDLVFEHRIVLLNVSAYPGCESR